MSKLIKFNITKAIKRFMPIKQIDHGSPEYMQMVELRNEILRKPLGISFSHEELGREKDDILIGAFEEQKILGCCLLTKADNKTVRLRQMAVLNSVQGKGIGATMMNYAENVARDNGYTKMVMHARKSAIGFYEKLGYKQSGDEFIEITIPHVTMEKRLR
ncbi:MAG: GNAT family N-acetyltransferase [Ginsengibacter sp.]